ncbi:MAG TPA: hypothetical protein PLW78_11240 [bacterium]|nr:hypothetical protein [bacterium]
MNTRANEEQPGFQKQEEQKEAKMSGEKDNSKESFNRGKEILRVLLKKYNKINRYAWGKIHGAERDSILEESPHFEEACRWLESMRPKRNNRDVYSIYELRQLSKCKFPGGLSVGFLIATAIHLNIRLVYCEPYPGISLDAKAVKREVKELGYF